MNRLKLIIILLMLTLTGHNVVNAEEMSVPPSYILTVISTDVKKTYNATSKEVLLDKLTLLEYSNKKDMSTAYRELSKKYTVAKDEDIEIEEEKYDKNSEYYLNEYFIKDKMRLDKAQEYASTGKPIKIGVLDTGGYNEDKYIADRIGKNSMEYSIEEKDKDGKKVINTYPVDYSLGGNSHGSEVTGLILDGTPDNVSVNFYMCNCYARVDEDGDGVKETVKGISKLSDVTKAITALVKDGCNIAHTSLGIEPSDLEENSLEVLEALFESLEEKKIPLIASAGNSVNSNHYIPQKYESTIVVGSIDGSNNLSEFSAKGVDVDFVAPGENINVISGYQASGTSFASPFITAFVADLMCKKTYSNVKQVEEDVKYYCTGLSPNKNELSEWKENFGWGLPYFHTEEEECSLLGWHDYTEWETIEPTCTDTGITKRECKKCGKIEKGDIIPAKGHKWKIDEVEATCTTGGYKTRTCIVCNTVETYDKKVPTGHSSVTVTNTSSTCTHKGHIISKCRVCGLILEDKDKELDPNKHDEDVIETTIKGSCVTPLTLVRTCSACGKEMGRDYFGYDKHKYVLSQTTEKYQIYRCSVCGAIRRDEIKGSTTESKESKTTEVSKTESSTNTEKSTEVSKTESSVSNAKVILPKSTVSSIKPSKKSIVAKVKKKKGYKVQLQLSTNKKFKKSTNKYITSGKYTFKKLKSKKKYYLRWRVYRMVGGKTIYSKWSKVKKIKVK